MLIGPPISSLPNSRLAHYAQLGANNPVPRHEPFTGLRFGVEQDDHFL